MKKQYKFYSDSGHGWLAVKKKELSDLCISDKISPYSYMKGKTAYLEEDCDYKLFIEAKKKAGEYKHMSIQESFQNRSPIRSYDPYECH